MRLLIVTGMSGAGKTQAIKAFEDMGDYCVDNMPPELIPKFAEIYKNGQGADGCAVLVCDLRGGDLFGKLNECLIELSEKGFAYDILFLDASDETLIRRYKETRREHPLSYGGRIIDGIQKERVLLQDIRKKADKIIDTSELSATQLKQQIKATYSEHSEFGEMLVHIISFGFKHGIPLDADMVFDVRFLPNPFYIPELKEHTGLETCIRDYVMNSEDSTIFMDKLSDMVKYLIPQFIKEGKTQFVIAVGCTGGHHRSVTVSELLYNEVKAMGRNVMVTHRDIKK